MLVFLHIQHARHQSMIQQNTSSPFVTYT
jgi:hypothetical protein